MTFFHYLINRQGGTAPEQGVNPSELSSELTNTISTTSDVLGPSPVVTSTTGSETLTSTTLAAGNDPAAPPTAVTATTDTASPVATNDSNKQTDGLGAGVVAGVAIGCLAGGLLIGITLGWFLRRAMRRSKHRKRGHGGEERAKILSQPKDDVPVALEPLGKKMKLENVILQPAPDQTILSDLGRLEDIIRQHVEAVYHSGPVDVKVVKLAHALTALGISNSSSGFDAETVAGWCLQPGTRRGALQHVISYVLFRSIDWNSPGPLTLLPKPAVGFLNSIRPVGEYRDNFDGKHKTMSLNQATNASS